MYSRERTSRTCSFHGSVKAVLLLSVRAYIRVPVFGIEIDRDVNATRNNLRLAQAMFSVGGFCWEVRQIDSVGLWQGVVQRTHNTIVSHKSLI